MGVGGTIVVLILALLFGGDIFSGGGGGGVPTTATEQGSIEETPEERRLVEFVSFVLDDAQRVWSEIIPKYGGQYREAKLVLFRDYVQSACGTGQSAMGPFYCPLDEKIYIDLGFYDALKERFGAPGDFAQAYVIAHELGHHVQNVLGTGAMATGLAFLPFAVESFWEGGRRLLVVSKLLSDVGDPGWRIGRRHPRWMDGRPARLHCELPENDRRSGSHAHEERDLGRPHRRARRDDGGRSDQLRPLRSNAACLGRRV